jgi:hypothetical protein
MLGTLVRAADRLKTSSLSSKIRWLRQNRSTDQMQQMQSDAIVELYDAVRQIQEAIWPMLLLIPDVGAVRDAAQGGSAAPAAGSSPAPISKAAMTSAFIRRP